MNLMNEKLIWMTEDDFALLMAAANVNSNLLNQPDESLAELVDLDGDPIGPEILASWKEVNDAAHFALARAKYVPEETLPKLKLILGSD